MDPRSLMQGDYMRLAWALERRPITLAGATGVLVLALDDRRVGSFRRLAGAEPPGPGERLFQVGRSPFGASVRVEPHSFLFQEGHADHYARARYGIFRVDKGGRHLLVGLADANAEKIDPR